MPQIFSSNDIPFSAIYDQNCIKPKAEKNRLASDERHVDNGSIHGSIQVSELQIERGGHGAGQLPGRGGGQMGAGNVVQYSNVQLLNVIPTQHYSLHDCK